MTNFSRSLLELTVLFLHVAPSPSIYKSACPWFFVLLVVSFAVQKLLSVIRSQLFVSLLFLLFAYCCSVAKLCLTVWPYGLKHARLPCPPVSPGVCSNSCSLSQWHYITISSSATASPLAFNLSQHQGLFQWVNSSHQVARVLELQL